MKVSYISKAAAISMALLISSISITACGKYNSANVPGSKAETTDGQYNFEGNTDITAGVTSAEGYYYCEASIGDSGISATVDALASSIKTSDLSNVSKIGDKSEKVLNDARIKYLMDYYAEDEETAKNDIAELYSDPAPTDAQFAAIRDNYDEISKVISQFGISYFDFSSPYINNSENPETVFLEYDLYTDDYRLFNIDVMFEGDKISSIDIYEDYDVQTDSSTEAAG